jgi:hypothetical protein
MSISLSFDGKGNATLVDTDGERATLECDFSSPPGSPLSGRIVVSHQRVQFKVHECRRVSSEAQHFVIRGRWVNLSRVARAELLGSPAESDGA